MNVVSYFTQKLIEVIINALYYLKNVKDALAQSAFQYQFIYLFTEIEINTIQTMLLLISSTKL